MAGNTHRCPIGGALSPSVTGPSSRCPVAPFAPGGRREESDDGHSVNNVLRSPNQAFKY